jgi:alpha-amylase/alpha-mannosidase (GH57 family)
MAEIFNLSMKGISITRNLAKMVVGLVRIYLKSVIKFVSTVVPIKKINIETIKQDIWNDLSAVYYKYEDDSQKRAFREILSDISEKLNEGQWDRVYKKLYSAESYIPKSYRLV